MKKIKILFCALFLTGAVMAQISTTNSQPAMHNPEPRPLMIDTTATGPLVEICTNLGNIKIRLYDDTPSHRDNFLKLVDNGDYNGVLFHRVIKDFMVQTGDLNSKNPDNTIPLGAGDVGYTLPAEINYPRHFHKYGALAAARTGDEVNPEYRSSGSQFYIVTGNVWNAPTLERMAESKVYQQKQAFFQNQVRNNWSKIEELRAASDTASLKSLEEELIKLTESTVKSEPMPENIKEVYSTIGGTPHLDGTYTVFGEVLEGMDVVEKIQHTPVDKSDNPVTPVIITGMHRL